MALKARTTRTDLYRDCEDRPDWVSGNDVDNDAWEDSVRDSPHLNWNEGYEDKAVPLASGSPLDALAWEVLQFSGSGSFMMDYFDKRTGYPTVYYDSDDDDTYLHPCQTRDFEALKRHSSWHVVMRVIVVHSDFRSAVATGLFGLLGDERVQIVNASEEARVGAFMDLAEACECKASVTVSQDFRRVSVDSMKQQLRDAAMTAFNSEELIAAMRPAFMFRLCTQMCNHRSSSNRQRSRWAPVQVVI